MMKIDESAFNKLFSSKVYGAIREFQVFKNLLFQRIHSYGSVSPACYIDVQKKID